MIDAVKTKGGRRGKMTTREGGGEVAAVANVDGVPA
jgi:hypothetical protein